MAEASVVERHRRACAGFDRAVTAAAGGNQWEAPTPCTGWDATALVDHVAGIHRMMATQLGEPVSEQGDQAGPGDDPAAAWGAARDAVFLALAREGALDAEVDAPGGMGQVPAGRLLNILTTDVLVHTWDLARAVGADETLDAELCQRAFDRARPADELLRASGMFAPKVEVGADADVQVRMLAFFGRSP